MERTVVIQKNGYKIDAEVHPKTKRLHNFRVIGTGANKNATYPHLSDAQSVMNYHLKIQEEKNKKK